MKRRIAITDLTRMREGRVCLAGYHRDEHGALRCVRPLFREGDLTEAWLSDGEAVVVRPFAIVELDLRQHWPDSPHTEDWFVDPAHRVHRGALSADGRRKLLDAILDADVAGIFGAPIHRDPGWYVKATEGHRSLGTIEPRDVAVVHGPKPSGDGWEYRIAFADATGARYRLSVSDLAFRGYIDERRGHEASAAHQAAENLTATLRNADCLYLRIGLTRGWGEFRDRRFLQITGVHAFPDYLGGRCFADFAPLRALDGSQRVPRERT